MNAKYIKDLIMKHLGGEQRNSETLSNAMNKLGEMPHSWTYPGCVIGPAADPTMADCNDIGERYSLMYIPKTELYAMGDCDATEDCDDCQCIPVEKEFNGHCPICGGRAYIGMHRVECRNNCDYSDTEE